MYRSTFSQYCFASFGSAFIFRSRYSSRRKAVGRLSGNSALSSLQSNRVSHRNLLILLVVSRSRRALLTWSSLALIFFLLKKPNWRNVEKKEITGFDRPSLCSVVFHSKALLNHFTKVGSLFSKAMNVKSSTRLWHSALPWSVHPSLVWLETGIFGGPSQTDLTPIRWLSWPMSIVGLASQNTGTSTSHRCGHLPRMFSETDWVGSLRLYRVLALTLKKRAGDVLPFELQPNGGEDESVWVNASVQDSVSGSGVPAMPSLAAIAPSTKVVVAASSSRAYVESSPAGPSRTTGTILRKTLAACCGCDLGVWATVSTCSCASPASFTLDRLLWCSRGWCLLQHSDTPQICAFLQWYAVCLSPRHEKHRRCFAAHLTRSSTLMSLSFEHYMTLCSFEQ